MNNSRIGKPSTSKVEFFTTTLVIISVISGFTHLASWLSDFITRKAQDLLPSMLDPVPAQTLAPLTGDMTIAFLVVMLTMTFTQYAINKINK